MKREKGKRVVLAILIIDGGLAFILSVICFIGKMPYAGFELLMVAALQAIVWVLYNHRLPDPNVVILGEKIQKRLKESLKAMNQLSCFTGKAKLEMSVELDFLTGELEEVKKVEIKEVKFR